VRATFLDPDLEARMQVEGFVVVPFLEDDEVAQLRDAFDCLGADPADPQLATISTFHGADPAHKRTIDAAIRTAFARSSGLLFDRQRMLPASLLVKWPGEMSGVGLHQDLAHVDEGQHASVGVWVALEDTDDVNGQIWFAPGSHEWLPTVRGIQAFPFPFEEVAQAVVERHSVPVPIKAGEAIVFPQRSLHFSMPNRSDHPRVVATANFIPLEAQHLQYFGDGEGAVYAYALDDEFWFANNPFTLWRPPPAARRVGEAVRFAPRTMTLADLDDAVATGRAQVTGYHPGGPVNAPYAWCYRCGGTDGFDEAPGRWIGNVTLLCPTCQVGESVRAASAAHAGATIDRAELDERGWTTVALLGADQVAQLTAAFESLGIEPSAPFHATSVHSPREASAAVDELVRALLAPLLSKLLPDLFPFLGSFIYKGAGSGQVDLHQDWTFQDERCCRSYVVWCPLVDVGAESGALHFLPGSHRWTDWVRGSGSVPDILPPSSELAWAAAQPQALLAGHAVIYDVAVVHGSTPNPQARPVVAVALGTAGQPLVHVQHTAAGTTAVAVEGEHFTRNTYATIPDGACEVTCPGPLTRTLTDAELAAHLGVAAPVAVAHLTRRPTLCSPPARRGLRHWIARLSGRPEA